MLLAGPVASAQTLPDTADALVDTVNRACIPALTRTLVWPGTRPGSGDLAAEDKLLAELGMTRGVSNAFVEKLKTVDPRLDALSRAVLASRKASDGSFAFLLGGIDPNCRLLVDHIADRAALAKQVEAKIVALGWKFALAKDTGTPKRAFVRRAATSHVLIFHLTMPPADAPYAPIIIIDALPPATRVPAGLLD